ncbi:hypothetical protein BD626DRAFT_544754 [Schizophyllum amplum]|uniref:Fungal-type protein kinase domain-containing protein n=1 Tax=Schizophyllum amplum TaxID=97359 RepID=A0A550CZZ7_9AGAR|nr:hypothetical protein BD626DRAFT_544754 [Auriculariopsis ampla]
MTKLSQPHPKHDLETHHVDQVAPPKPDDAQATNIRSFLRETPLYDYAQRRWLDIPASPIHERDLYLPQTAILSALMEFFNIGDRRLGVTGNKDIDHAVHVDGQLKTSPAYRFVGRGRLVNGESRFPPSSTSCSLPIDCGRTDYEFVTTLGDAKTDADSNPLGDGIQLSVHAEQCFSQQHNREFVLTFIMTEKSFRVFRFDRCGMMSTTYVNFHEDPVAFVHLFGLICSDDAESIGYNPTLYFEDVHGQCTRYYESTFLRILDDEAPQSNLATNEVPSGDDDGKLGTARPCVEEKLKIRVNSRPLHFRRGLRGRGGVYWAGEHATLGTVIVKQSYRPSGRVPEWKFLRKAVGVTGVGQMLAYDTRVWRVTESRWPGGTGDGTKFHDCEWSSIVLRRYGDSIDHFKDHIQILVTLRDAINGHRGLWDMYILHRDVSITNILMGVLDAPEGWKGVLIDLDMAVSLLSESSKVGVDYRTGTRAFQSLHVLNSYEYELADPDAQTVPPDSQRLMHDYSDDLESFYWCLCWICFSYDGPGKFAQTDMLTEWGSDSPRQAFAAKMLHLALPFQKEAVKPWFRPFVPLLEHLHDFCLENYNGRQTLVEKERAHIRDVSAMRKDSKQRYNFVLHAIQTTIDDLEAGGPLFESDDEDDIDVGGGQLPSLSVELLKPQRALPYSHSSSTKRKSQEELDESPTKKNRGPARPSSLRHSGESHDA